MVVSASNYAAGATATLTVTVYADTAASTMFSGVADTNLMRLRLFIDGVDFTGANNCLVEVSTATCVGGALNEVEIEIAQDSLIPIIPNALKLKVSLDGVVLPASAGVRNVWALFYDNTAPLQRGYGNGKLSVGAAATFTSFTLSANNLDDFAA